MKLVLCDLPSPLRRGTEYELQRLGQAFPEAELVVHPYQGEEALLAELERADGCITGFLRMGEDLFSRCRKLRVVSVNATGYDNIDLEAARRHRVTVCAVRDYCTQEVAEHALALMLAVARKLKVHQYALERDGIWQYRLAAPVYRLSGRTLAIFGFGRIGRAVAQRARGFGLEILAVDPYLPEQAARDCGVQLVSPAEAAVRADIVTNHMNVSGEGTAYFDRPFFHSLRRAPIFLNLGRGRSVDEGALLEALELGLVSGAGLDVLSQEQPDLGATALFRRADVVITPHAAFYSEDSLRALQDISCDNLIAVLRGEPERADHIVSAV